MQPPWADFVWRNLYDHPVRLFMRADVATWTLTAEVWAPPQLAPYATAIDGPFLVSGRTAHPDRGSRLGLVELHDRDQAEHAARWPHGLAFLLVGLRPRPELVSAAVLTGKRMTGPSCGGSQGL